MACHLAAASLQTGESSPAALASGVNAILLPLGASAAMSQVQALSPDGRCKAFAADADGYGRGEGFASIVIETRTASSAPLAVLSGSAVNQDGRSSGLTAPHGPSQAALVAAAMRQAGTAALDLVSTHGTGTPLGDPIESGAIRKANSPLHQPSEAGLPLTLTAVKVLTGHLEGCAGLAGLLQAVASLKHHSSPPLRLRSINPHVAGERDL